MGKEIVQGQRQDRWQSMGIDGALYINVYLLREETEQRVCFD